MGGVGTGVYPVFTLSTSSVWEPLEVVLAVTTVLERDKFSVEKCFRIKFFRGVGWRGCRREIAEDEEGLQDSGS